MCCSIIAACVGAEEAGRGRELMQEPAVQKTPPQPTLKHSSPPTSVPEAAMKGLSLGDGAPTASTAKEAAAKRGISGQK